MPSKEQSEEARLSQQIRLEQASAAMMGFAGVLAVYYKALKKEGFSPSEALALTIAYQEELVRDI